MVTPESEARYRKLAAAHGAASLSSYDAEMAKGTDPADIFDKGANAARGSSLDASHVNRPTLRVRALVEAGRSSSPALRTFPEPTLADRPC